jgi:Zn-finger protein
MNPIEEVKEAETRLKNKIAEAAKNDVLKTFFLNAFQNLPAKVQKVQWTQYTPHFNDGEPCVFGIHGLYAVIDGVTGDSSRHEARDVWDLSCHKHITEGERKVLEEFERQLEEIQTILNIAFGDGVQVTLDREGNMEVEDYDHD